MKNDTHTTDDEKYRIPSHPEMISALGRVVWNFLTIENQVAELLAETGYLELVEARDLMAGKKLDKLKALRKKLEKSKEEVPNDLIEKLTLAIQAFKTIKDEHRNPLLHAGFFTQGHDEDGTYLPGIAMKVQTTQERRWVRDSKSLHDIAHQVEAIIDPLHDARQAIRQHKNLIHKILEK